MGEHVRYWHKADIASCTAHVRFRGKADVGGSCWLVQIGVFVAMSSVKIMIWAAPAASLVFAHFLRRGFLSLRPS